MGNVCMWVLEKRIHLFQHLKEEKPLQTPPDWWWVVIAGINALTAQVNIVFIKLQAKGLLVSQQSAELTHLTSLIRIQVGIDGPHSQEDLAALNKIENFVLGRWSIRRYNVIKYLFDQGMFVRELFLLLDLKVQYQVISMVGQLVLDVVDGVLEIQAERNCSNNATDDLPPTLPHELAKIHGSAFGEIL